MKNKRYTLIQDLREVEYFLDKKNLNYKLKSVNENTFKLSIRINKSILGYSFIYQQINNEILKHNFNIHIYDFIKKNLSFDEKYLLNKKDIYKYHDMFYKNSTHIFNI